MADRVCVPGFERIRPARDLEAWGFLGGTLGRDADACFRICVHVYIYVFSSRVPLSVPGQAAAWSSAGSLPPVEELHGSGHTSHSAGLQRVVVLGGLRPGGGILTGG